MFTMVKAETTRCRYDSFCSENINEAVSILRKGVGVTFGSRGLGVLGKRFHFNEIR